MYYFILLGVFSNGDCLYLCQPPPLIVDQGLVMARCQIVDHPRRAKMNIQIVGHPFFQTFFLMQ